MIFALGISNFLARRNRLQQHDEVKNNNEQRVWWVPRDLPNDESRENLQKSGVVVLLWIVVTLSFELFFELDQVVRG